MAEVDGYNGNSVHCSLIVNIGANNASGNYTPVSWALYAQDTYGASWSGESPCTGAVYINGAGYGYSYWWNSPGTGTRTLQSGSANIYHNADGTGAFGFSFTFSGIPGTSNSAGCSGSSSAGLAGIPPTAPSTPTADTQTVPGNVTIHFSMGAGSTPSTYTIQADDDPGFGSPTTFTTSNTPYTLTGLTRGSTQYIRVQGSNASGTGPFGGALTVTLLAGGKVSHDGTTFVPALTQKRWNGSSWVTITTAKRWNGTAWVNLT